MSPNVSPVSQVAALCERRVRKRSGGSVRTRAGSGVVERAPAAPTMSTSVVSSVERASTAAAAMLCLVVRMLSAARRERASRLWPTPMVSLAALPQNSAAPGAARGRRTRRTVREGPAP